MSVEPKLQQWVTLFPNAHTKDLAETFREVRGHYQEAGRNYHSWRHPGSMLAMAEQYFPDAPVELGQAIFGHDLIYDVFDGGGGRSERDSAEAMGLIMSRLSCTDAMIGQVQQAIICTIDHYPTSLLAEMLCDLDLIGMATSFDNFSADGVKIRAEYSHLTDEQWRLNRIAFITSLVGQEQIFYSPQIEPERELEARHNLHSELARLKSMQV